MKKFWLKALSLVSLTTALMMVQINVAEAGCSSNSVKSALFPSLAINGVQPQGQASGFNKDYNCSTRSATLTVQVKSVNLPDGTLLTVLMDYGTVGIVKLSGGSGSISVTYPGATLFKNRIQVYTSSGTQILFSQQLL
jgi:hypothetical protein